MLSSPRVRTHPRRSPNSFPGITPIPCRLLVLPAPIISGSAVDGYPILFLTDHCPLNTAYSRSKSFRCNTYGSPRKCCKQKTYGQAKPFRCNTYKKPGGGGRGVAVPFLKKNFKCLGIATDSRHFSTDQMNEGSLAVTTTSALTSYSLTTENCKLTTLSVQRRNRAALLPPPVQVVHRYVQVHAPTRRLDANHQRFRLGAAAQPRFV